MPNTRIDRLCDTLSANTGRSCRPDDCDSSPERLQMGFRTLAIEKRSIEGGYCLEGKDRVDKFGNVLEKTRQTIEQAART
jgi:hypothetical protein